MQIVSSTLSLPFIFNACDRDSRATERFSVFSYDTVTQNPFLQVKIINIVLCEYVHDLSCTD